MPYLSPTLAHFLNFFSTTSHINTFRKISGKFSALFHIYICENLKNTNLEIQFSHRITEKNTNSIGCDVSGTYLSECKSLANRQPAIFHRSPAIESTEHLAKIAPRLLGILTQFSGNFNCQRTDSCPVNSFRFY